MTSGTPGSPASRAEALIPKLRERAGATDRDRRVPDETIRDLLDAKLLQMLAPKRFGGAEERLSTFLDVGISIGRGCGSTAWLFGILGGHHWMLSHFPLEAQETLYGGRDHALWPLSFSGKGGTAKPVDGGYLVSGRWAFASGVDYADWVGCAPLLDKAQPDDLLDRVNVIMRKSEVEVVDTWFTSGMRGTGSRDIVARDVFVPRERVLSQAALQSGDTPGRASLADYVGLGAPFFSIVLCGLLCPVLGLARRSIEDFAAFTRERAGFRGINHAARASTQGKIGLAQARYDSAYRTARAMFAEIDDTVRSGGSCTLEQRFRQRRDAAFVADECVRLVDSLVASAGAGSQHESSAFQLIQRDIHTIRPHVAFDLEAATETYGQLMLGQEPSAARA